MKSPAPAGHTFTLVEGVVMVVVFLMLSGLVISFLVSPRRYGVGPEHHQTTTMLRSVVHACEAYQADYGRFPPIESANDGAAYAYGERSAGCRRSNEALFDVLRAIPRGENAGHALNTRQVKYIEGAKASDPQRPRGGFCDGQEFSNRSGQLLDPWGGQYCIILESDDDEVIEMRSYYPDLAGEAEVLRFPAIAFSVGPDGRRGGDGRYRKPPTTDGSDDIVSWTLPRQPRPLEGRSL